MKNTYERASMSTVLFAKGDIITTSGPLSDSKDPIFLPEDVF